MTFDASKIDYENLRGLYTRLEVAGLFNPNLHTAESTPNNSILVLKDGTKWRSLRYEGSTPPPAAFNWTRIARFPVKQASPGQDQEWRPMTFSDWNYLEFEPTVLAPQILGLVTEEFIRPRTLLEYLIAAPCLSRNQLKPVMEYMNLVLVSQKKFKLRKFKFIQDKASNVVALASTFPNFRKLPLELQENIWERALPGSRIFEVGHSTRYHLSLRVRSSQREPTKIASACKVAQKIVRKHYTTMEIAFDIALDFAFGKTMPGAEWNDPSYKLFVNYENDVFYFGSLPPYSLFDPGNTYPSEDTSLMFIKCIAFKASLFASLGWHTLEDLILKQPPSNMPCLQEIVFVGDIQRFERRRGGRGVIPQPLIWTDFEDESTHPYCAAMVDAIQEIRTIATLPAVVKAYRHVKISYAISEEEHPEDSREGK